MQIKNIILTSLLTNVIPELMGINLSSFSKTVSSYLSLKTNHKFSKSTAVVLYKSCSPIIL